MKRTTTRPEARPLVELAEGRDQDDRSDLYLAYRRCAQWRKVTHSNLHVRELLFYVAACDRDGRGVQKSYAEIAERLELKDDQAARYVITRAAKDFRLLLITEARYERGGQTANRYSVNWPLVRAIRDGLEDGRPYQAPREPGVTESQAGVTESQAGVTESHPYKEYSRTNTRTNSFNSHTTNTSNRDKHGHPEPDHEPACEPDHGQTVRTVQTVETWEVVVSELMDLEGDFALSRRGTARAVEAARTRGLTVEGARALMELYRERSRDPYWTDEKHMNVGWLARWLTGDSAPEPERKKPRWIEPGLRGDAISREQLSRETLRVRIVRAGRQAGASQDEIEKRLAQAGV